MKHTLSKTTLAGALVFLASTIAFGSTTRALDDPAIQQIATMAEAGMSEQVILAKAAQIGAFPVLSGDDLTRLKELGISDAVLVFMIEHAQEEIHIPTPAPPTPAPATDTGAEDPEGGIRVIVDRDFRITYYEVVIDDEIVQHAGKLWEGKSDPGVMLRRPRILKGDAVNTAYEAAVEPGSYEISVGFAFSTVEGDPRDEWGEYEGEWYVTRGIRATGEPLPNQQDGDNPGAVCTMAKGQICEVRARLGSKRPTPLGGLPDYSITYEVTILN